MAEAAGGADNGAGRPGAVRGGDGPGLRPVRAPAGTHTHTHTRARARAHTRTRTHTHTYMVKSRFDHMVKVSLTIWSKVFDHMVKVSLTIWSKGLGQSAPLSAGRVGGRYALPASGVEKLLRRGALSWSSIASRIRIFSWSRRLQASRTSSSLLPGP